MEADDNKKRCPDFARLSPPGAAPGTISVDPTAPPPVLSVFAYRGDEYIETALEDISALPGFLEQWTVTWLSVTGLGDESVIRQIGEICDIHELALEDVVNVDQRAKLEDYEDHLFLVARMLRRGGERLESDQLSIFLAPRLVLTFQSRPGDCLGPVRDRIRKGRGHMQKHGADFLAYSILDAVVDAYFPALEEYGERLESLESAILERPSQALIAELHVLKRELLLMRRAIWPMREVVNSLIRDTNPIVCDGTRVYLRDCYDHAVRIIDLIENYRQVAADLMDVYLSSVSNRMNEVMKVLTVISTVFIPPTFVAGLYGMNFNYEISPYNMPELTFYFGYPLCILLMFLMSGSVVFFLYSRGFLGRSRS